MPSTTRHPGVLRRAHQHRQLSRGRPGDQAGRRDRSGARLRSQIRRGRHPLGRGDPESRKGARPDGRLGVGNPRACRPLVRRALHQGEDRREDRHRRAHQGCAAHLPADLQCHRSEDGRQRFRPSVPGWRAIQHRRVERRDAPHARPYPGGHQLQDRGCGLRRRHAVHAGLRHRARGFSGWRCPPALSLDQAAAGAARRRRACSCATTTRRPAAMPMPGRQRFSEQRDKNVHVGGGKTEAEFVAMRTSRDATLSAPTLLLPSIQVNIRAGAFPPAEDNGVRYLTNSGDLQGGSQGRPSPA